MELSSFIFLTFNKSVRKSFATKGLPVPAVASAPPVLTPVFTFGSVVFGVDDTKLEEDAGADDFI